MRSGCPATAPSSRTAPPSSAPSRTPMAASPDGPATPKAWRPRCRRASAARITFTFSSTPRAPVSPISATATTARPWLHSAAPPTRTRRATPVRRHCPSPIRNPIYRSLISSSPPGSPPGPRWRSASPSPTWATARRARAAGPTACSSPSTSRWTMATTGSRSPVRTGVTWRRNTTAWARWRPALPTPPPSASPCRSR